MVIRQQPSPNNDLQNTCLEIHQSLQLHILRGLTKERNSDKRYEIFNKVATMLQAVLPEASRLQQNEKDKWPAYDKYASQVLSLLKHSQLTYPPLLLDFSFAKMLSNIGTYLWHTGQIRECDIAMVAAERIINSGTEEERSSLESEKALSDVYLVTGILADCIGVSRRRESLEHRQLLLKMRQRE